MQKKAGFSLVELMIVLGIIAILSAIVTPNIISWLKGQGLKTAVSELQGNLQLAKLSSIRQNQSCTVTFDKGEGSYSIPCANKNVMLSSYSGGVVFGASTTDEMTFTSAGICSFNKSAYLTDQKNSAYYRIQTFNSGGITVSKVDSSSF
ncbi:MAG: prepilin-type N-terminal cleavage/methylation domain-containing protein [Proteobacteria bacterium]|nr:prepilin-type N-terminal cleavage/methylation domain-containing protein [Pseudomonadota bacterium]